MINHFRQKPEMTNINLLNRNNLNPTVFD